MKNNLPVKTAVPSPRKIKIRVVGLGGGGAAIVSEMSAILKGVSFTAADTDIKTFRRIRRDVKPFHFGEKITNGFGTGLNPDLAQKAALDEKEKIARLFKDCDLAILVGCLGGGVASGAGPIFAQLASEQKAITIGIFTLPFSFEGDKKIRLAKKAAAALTEKLSGMIAVPNERIFLLVDKKTALKKSFSLVNQTFAFWINDLLQVVARPGLINIDFADLRAILEKQGKRIFFGQAVSQGPLRAEEIAKNIFQSPFFDGPPKNVKKILFNITGGPDLGIKEVETISNAIAGLNPKAKIIFGISEAPSCKGKIRIILLAVSDDENNDNNEEPGKVLAKNQAAGPEKQNKGKAKRQIKKQNKLAESGEKKPMVRRSAIEVKKADEEEKDREWAPEAEWEVPTFLRNKSE
ncbi:MAG: cell division protein FtsZ [Patescibacteria group bacterium]